MCPNYLTSFFQVRNLGVAWLDGFGLEPLQEIAVKLLHNRAADIIWRLDQGWSISKMVYWHKLFIGRLHSLPWTSPWCCFMNVITCQLYFPRVIDLERTKWEPLSIYNLASEITHHHACNILLVYIHLPSSFWKGKGVHKGDNTR